MYPFPLTALDQHLGREREEANRAKWESIGLTADSFIGASIILLTAEHNINQFSFYPSFISEEQNNDTKNNLPSNFSICNQK